VTVSHITDLFEGHNFNRYKDSRTDDGTEKLPKRVGDFYLFCSQFS